MSEIINRSLGIFVADPLDYIYVPITGTLLNRVDLRNYSEAVEDQSTMNSCTANAVASVCEMFLTANNQFDHLSRRFNYYESRDSFDAVVDNVAGDLGIPLKYAIAAAKQMGMPLETTWPYTVGGHNTRPSEAAYTEAALSKITRYERIEDGIVWNYETNTGSYDAITIGSYQYLRDMKSALNQSYPLIIGIPITEAFYALTGSLEYQFANPYSGVTVDNPDIGGHAVVVVGYDDNYGGFIIQNSWGSGWGYGGFALLPYNTIVDLYECWVIKGFAGLTLPTTSSTTSGYTSTIPELSIDPKYFFDGEPFMAISNGQLVWRKALGATATTATNGGLVDFASTIASGGANNLFNNVGQTERLNGSTVNRKVFLGVNKGNATFPAEELLNVLVTAGLDASNIDDFMVLREGTKTDTEETMLAADPARRYYGSGLTNASVDAGALGFVITPQSSKTEAMTFFTTNEPFKTGDTIVITNGSLSDVCTVDTVTYNASTITLTIVEGVVNGYASGALVSSAISVSSVLPAFTTPQVTSAAGVFSTGAGASATFKVNSKVTPDETWTITFSSATAFSMVGSVHTTPAFGGSINSQWTPVSGISGEAFFKLDAACFSGTWQAGDTIVFSTVSATVPVWVTRIVPAGTTNVSTDFCSINCMAETY